MVLDRHPVPSQDRATPKLLDHAANALRDFGLDQPAAAAAVEVMRQFVLFHGKRHPQQMGMYEVEQFLDSVAAGRAR